MKKSTLIISFIITFFLFSIVTYKIVNNITNFKHHRTYIKQSINDQKIQDWMTINYLHKKFGIDLSKILSKEINIIDTKKTLKEYCDKTQINCPELIITLESYKNGK